MGLEQKVQETARELFAAESGDEAVRLSTELSRLGFSHFRSPLPLGTVAVAHSYSVLSGSMVRNLTMRYADHPSPIVRATFIKTLAYFGSATESEVLWDKLRHERSHHVIAAAIQSLRMIAGPTSMSALSWAYHSHPRFQSDIYAALEHIMQHTKKPYAPLNECPDVTPELNRLLGLS